MANINKELNKIKNAVKGKEVRGSIHDGIDKINKETESTTNKQEVLSDTFEQLVIDKGNSNAEVVASRGKESWLPDRLDKTDKKIDDNHTATNQQLAETEKEVISKADKEYVDRLVKQLASGGRKGIFDTLSELAIAYPDGSEGVYLVKENGHWYYWNDAQWEDGGQYQESVESDFPARNLVPNASFWNGRTTWQVNGGETEIIDDSLNLTSSGASNILRITQSSTGYTPKKGDKIFSSMRVNFKTAGFLKGKISIRDWVAGGTFNKYKDIDTSKTDVQQDVTLYTSVTENFVDQLRFYVEADIKSSTPNIEMIMSRPIILNLTQIFGAGNEPSEEQVVRLLKKFGGWFEGNIDEFVTKEEIKIISNEAESKASNALNKADVVTSDLTLLFNNLIQNGDFYNEDFLGGNHWKRVGVTNTKAKDFEVSFSAVGQDQSLSQTIQAKRNHIYYAWAQIKSTSNQVSLMVSGNLNSSRAHTGSGNYEFLSCKHIRDNDAGVNIEIRDKRTSDWNAVSAKYIGCIDLTETFGAGNEPETHEVDRFIEKLINKWFEGKRNNIMSLSETNEHYKNVRKKAIKTIEHQNENPKKYFIQSPPKLVMTITYDDECSSIYDLAKPIHESENVPGVFYVVPSRIGTRQIYNYGVADEWLRIKEMSENSLIDIEHHTYAHFVLTNSDKDYLEWQIERSQEMFERNGIFPKHLAYPGGTHNFETINVLQDFVETGVTTSPLVNGYDLNPYRISRYGMDERTVEEIKTFIDGAIITGGWLVTYQHGLATSGMSLGGYQIQTPDNQREIIQYAKSKGVEFVSFDKGLEMYKPYDYVTDPNNIDNALYSLQKNGIVVTG